MLTLGKGPHMLDRMRGRVSYVSSWLFQDKHRRLAQHLKDEAGHAFTDHPHQTGETYLQHLWFTIRMSGRFAYVSFVVVIHGIFPFLFVKTASQEIERVYGIMKSRIPQQRRDELDGRAKTIYGDHI